jgi:hypothetical protein
LAYDLWPENAGSGIKEWSVDMKQSFCGLCENCNLDNPEFLQAIATVKRFLDQFWVYWWVNCIPKEASFSLDEFRKGIEWFLHRPECPGCAAGLGLASCPIRRCAQQRGVDSCCNECPELDTCSLFDLILMEYPNQKNEIRHKHVSDEPGKSKKS